MTATIHRSRRGCWTRLAIAAITCLTAIHLSTTAARAQDTLQVLHGDGVLRPCAEDTFVGTFVDSVSACPGGDSTATPRPSRLRILIARYNLLTCEPLAKLAICRWRATRSTSTGRRSTPTASARAGCSSAAEMAEVPHSFGLLARPASGQPRCLDLAPTRRQC